MIATTAYRPTMEYIVEHGGLDTEKSYPYKAIKGDKCRAKEGKLGATISNFTFVGKNEIHMAHALGTRPASINAAVDAILRRWRRVPVAV